MVEFDSQRPYPQLCDFFESDPRLTTTSTAAGPIASMAPPPHISVEEVQPVVQALKLAFGLELFGFDILVTTNTTHTSNSNVVRVDGREQRLQPELWVVDVNYFPSYKEVSNFSSLLAQYLTQRAIQGRRRRSQDHPVENVL
jgi:inositol-1,3,4-trisphosphate 5/6-kinase/inositol-tetrakisphosphate 1-kinase